MTTHIIYLPGLGDGYDGPRSWAVRSWRVWGVRPTYVPIIWQDGAELASKLAKIKAVIDRIPKGERIVLVGESAGAALALHTAVKDTRVAKVITLCGVSSPTTPISRQLRKSVPALDQAVASLPATFDVDIHSVRAAYDDTVNKPYSIVPGSVVHVVWSAGHRLTIAICLTFLAPFLVAIAKK